MNNYANSVEANQSVTPTISNQEGKDQTKSMTNQTKYTCAGTATIVVTDQKPSTKSSKSALEEKIWEIMRKCWNLKIVRTPVEVIELMTRLSISLGTLGDELAHQERICAIVQSGFLAEGQSNAASEVRMNATQEYEDYKRKKRLYESMQETINSLKRELGFREVEYNKA